MANPQLLLLDSDVLIQVFIGAELRPLKTLKKVYGIQAAIVPEVEAEIAWSKKFRARFDPDLRKALGNGTIEVLDARTFSALVSGTTLSAAAAVASYASIQSLGAQYSYRVGRGEAYTLATAVSVGQPAASNDRRALDVLGNAGLNLPSPVLRSYDLIVFAFQIGLLNDADCEQFRKMLLRESEFIPKAFRASSFQDGLRDFIPRLLDSTLALPPVAQPTSSALPFESPLLITRLDLWHQG